MLKKEVLRKQRDFDSVYKKGKSVPDKYIVVFFRKNRLSYCRTAFLASKKVGNSVYRNRARRLMKEALRLSEKELPCGYDFIFVARKSICSAKCQQVQKSMNSALRRTSIIK